MWQAARPMPLVPPKTTAFLPAREAIWFGEKKGGGSGRGSEKLVNLAALACVATSRLQVTKVTIRFFKFVWEILPMQPTIQTRGKNEHPPFFSKMTQRFAAAALLYMTDDR
jgi:hypothetical protein